MSDAAAGDVLVLEVDLVVEEGHDQTGRGTAGAALLPLVTADGVVAVDGALILLVEAAEDGIDVVGEKALLVEDGGEALRAGVDRHGLAVAVAVHLADGVEALLEGLAVGREADDGQQDVGVLLRRRRSANFEDLGGEAGVDGVAGRRSGIAGHHGEAVTGHGDSGTTVIGIAVHRALYVSMATSFSLFPPDKKLHSRQKLDVRVEAVFPEAVTTGLRRLGKRVVGSIEDRVLAEHGHLE